MATAIITFLISAAVIVAAGTVLTWCADAIAEATGLGRLVIGSILLAGATSLPELAVDLTAVRLQLPDLAVGDLLGSSLMNLLILAVLDLLHYSRGKMFSQAAAAHALSGTLTMTLTAIVGLGLLTADHTAGWELLGIHASIWCLILGYVMGVRLVFINQRIARAAENAAPADEPSETLSTGKATIGFVTAAAAILAAGPFLARSAGHIAEQSGLGNTFVGTTIVALSTALPELVTSLAAVRRGAFDLAVGNIFGSNAFNMLLLAPLDFAHGGSLLAAVDSVHAVSCFGIMIATAVVIMGQLYQAESRKHFIEPDAGLVIVLIVAVLAIIYAVG